MLMAAFAATGAQAQNYTNSRYYDSQTNRLNYNQRNYSGWGMDDSYIGLRIGPAFTYVSSDDPKLNGNSTTTGLNIGFVYGTALSNDVPLYLETGLSYVEKGGKSKYLDKKFTYELNYLELPFVAKYIYEVDDDFTVQPYLGGYMALGVGGKIKDYGEREAYSSFGKGADQFQRFDGGIRLGCGMSYDMFYAELGYDIGLSNIGHDDFDDTKNSALYLTFGVNF